MSAGNYQIADVRKRIRNANWFRNRIAHHEPIYDANLTAYYSDATTVTAWICSDLAAWVRKNNRVSAVVRNETVSQTSRPPSIVAPRATPTPPDNHARAHRDWQHHAQTL
jgi:hypothetical protein